jgi:hypothetical protein
MSHPLARSSPSRRARSRGQALIEMALVVPIVVMLFLGVWTAADLINVKDTVDHSVREGARVAAEIGNSGYPTGMPKGCQLASGQANDPCIVDAAVFAAMKPILTNQLSHATVTEIDVYQVQPCPAGTDWGSGCPPDNGAYQGAPYKINRYRPDGSPMPGGCCPYTLDLRIQTHPTEASIGVRVLFHYSSPTLAYFTSDQTAYAVIRLAPIFA